jgi:hypothetical protein
VTSRWILKQMFRWSYNTDHDCFFPRTSCTSFIIIMPLML